MSHIFADRVKETSITTGTGTFTLSGASTGAVTFNSVMANGDTCDYCIEGLNANGTQSGQWEVGIGTYTDPDTLARTTVVASSNSGSAVDFSAGTKNVFLTLRAGTIVTPETGTFTPIAYGVSTAGTGTYTIQSGTYIKIGKAVIFVIRIAWTAHTGTGNIRISALPYAPSVGTMFACGADNLTFTGQLMVFSDSTVLTPVVITNGAGNAGIAMDTSCALYISGTYVTA